MVNEDFIRFLVLNGFSQQNCGLMYGKTGIALALFKISRFLQDEKVEENAYDMISEVLASTIRNKSFDNGKIGIAWALLYLIKNQYIDADYMEIYGEEHNIILRSMEMEEYNNTSQLIDALYFLQMTESIIAHSIYKKTVKRIEHKVFSSLLMDTKFLNEHFYFFSTKIIGLYNIYKNVWIKSLTESIVKYYKKIYTEYTCNNLPFCVELLIYGVENHDYKLVSIANSLIDIFFSNLVISSIDYKTSVDIAYYIKKVTSLSQITQYANIEFSLKDKLYDISSSLYHVDSQTLASLKGGIPRLMWSNLCDNYNLNDHLIMLQ